VARPSALRLGRPSELTSGSRSAQRTRFAHKSIRNDVSSFVGGFFYAGRLLENIPWAGELGNSNTRISLGVRKNRHNSNVLISGGRKECSPQLFHIRRQHIFDPFMNARTRRADCSDVLRPGQRRAPGRENRVCISQGAPLSKYRHPQERRPESGQALEAAAFVCRAVDVYHLATEASAIAVAGTPGYPIKGLAPQIVDKCIVRCFLSAGDLPRSRNAMAARHDRGRTAVDHSSTAPIGGNRFSSPMGFIPAQYTVKPS